MRALLIIAAIVALGPMALALEAPSAVTIDAGNQRLDIHWPPVANATGYYVFVSTGGVLKQNLTVTETRATYLGATNGWTYTVEVAAHGADLAPGPRSLAAAATPELKNDSRYFALGVGVVLAGFGAYVIRLWRQESQINRKN